MYRDVTVGIVLRVIETLKKEGMSLGKAVNIVSSLTGLSADLLHRLHEYNEQDKEAAQ